MKPSTNPFLMTAKLFRILINTLAGITILYYLANIDQKLLNEDVWNSVTLCIFIIKFLADISIFKIGFSSFSLALLWLPIVSLLAFGPIGEVQALFNDRTQLIEKHFYLLAFSALFFYYCWSLLLLLDKKSFNHFDVNLLKYISTSSKSLLSTWTFSFISAVATIIYLPGIPGAPYDKIESTILPGNAWNAVAVIAYFFVVSGVKESIIRKCTLFFVPLWLLAHFARVDILGLILLAFIIFSGIKKGEVIKAKFSFFKLGMLAGGIFVFAYLGLVRDMGLVLDVETVVDSFLSIFNYLTVQDLLYSTAAAIEVNQNYGSFPTLLNYFPQLLPSFISASSEVAPNIVASYVHTNYGLLVYGEYYLNYQLLGVLLAPFITYLVLFLPVKILRLFFGSFGYAFGYYMLLTTIARVMWYGYTYYIKPMIIIVPVFILIYLITSSIDKQLAQRSRGKETEAKLSN